MKKQKNKKFLIKFLSILYFITIIVLSCNKEYEIEQENKIDETERIFNKISLDELKTKKELRKSFKILSEKFDINKSFSRGKNIEASDSSFTLLTDEIVEAINDTITTYTFLIETPTDSTSAFENFIFRKINQEFIFGIVKYKYNENYSSDFPYEISIQDINENQINLEDFSNFNKEMPTTHWDGNCLWVWYATGACDDCGYYHMENCIESGSGWDIPGTSSATTADDDNYDDYDDANTGTPGHETTQSGASSSVNSSSSSNNGINFAYAIGVIKDKTNCDIFKDLANDQPMKNLINTLKGMTNLSFETGLALTKNVDGSYSAIQGVPNAENQIEFTIPDGSTIDYIIHTHYTGSLSIFSAKDIQMMYNFVTNDNITISQDFVSIVVTPNDVLY